MKTYIIALAVVLITTTQLWAKRPKEIKNSEVEGFFISYFDFKENKITVPTDKQHEGDKIKLKQFFISPEMITIEQNKETVFYKDSIFAIHLSNGENYRFVNRIPYFIEDTTYLYIYTHKTTKTEFKNSGPRKISKEVPITYYYFSFGNHKEVFTLTVENLRKYVLSDTLLHKIVCDRFTDDKTLTMTNPKTGQFVINEIINTALRK